MKLVGYNVIYYHPLISGAIITGFAFPDHGEAWLGRK